MPSETHTAPEEIVDEDVPVDAFLNTIGTHVPDVSTAPEPPEDVEKEEKGKA
jgi:hypothetical protein